MAPVREIHSVSRGQAKKTKITKAMASKMVTKKTPKNPGDSEDSLS